MFTRGTPLSPGAVCSSPPRVDVRRARSPSRYVGTPTTTSLLEEVGSYAFGAARPQVAITNAQAEIEELPLEVDGICCFNAR